MVEDNYLAILKTFMTLNDIDSLYESEKEFLRLVVNDYGILDDLKKKFDEVFKIRLPLSKLPIKTHFAKNVEKLIDICENG